MASTDILGSKKYEQYKKLVDSYHTYISKRDCAWEMADGLKNGFKDTLYSAASYLDLAIKAIDEGGIWEGDDALACRNTMVTLRDELKAIQDEYATLFQKAGDEYDEIVQRYRNRILEEHDDMRIGLRVYWENLF